MTAGGRYDTAAAPPGRRGQAPGLRLPPGRVQPRASAWAGYRAPDGTEVDGVTEEQKDAYSSRKQVTTARPSAVRGV